MEIPAGMSALPSFDRETFQQLLASAFAVQESHLDSRSLSAIMEVQRLVMRRELDVEGAMRQIVETARNVANASGVTIGLLQGDQLVYRAASGSTAADIGRQVTASLTVSAATQASREILRVEDAEKDTRIEAAICRQFGARALLILPIYHDRSVAGVLEVLFSEAHAFEDREVRTYRLMAGQIEAAMNQTARIEQKRDLAAKLPATPHAMRQITPKKEKFKQPALRAATIMQRAKDVSWPKRRRNLSLAAVAVVLGLTCWIAYSGRRPAPPSESSAPPGSTTVDKQVPFQATKAMPARGTTAVQSAPTLVGVARRERPTPRRRVQVGRNEVDYIKDDVTIRIFTDKPAAQRKLTKQSSVAYIGDDVTVRYFTPKPAVRPDSR